VYPTVLKTGNVQQHIITFHNLFFSRKDDPASSLRNIGILSKEEGPGKFPGPFYSRLAGSVKILLEHLNWRRD